MSLDTTDQTQTHNGVCWTLFNKTDQEPGFLNQNFVSKRRCLNSLFIQLTSAEVSDEVRAAGAEEGAPPVHATPVRTARRVRLAFIPV